MLPKIARTAAVIGTLTIGTLAVAMPAQAADSTSAPRAEVATTTAAQAYAWPTWGIYRNLASCVSEGMSLKSAGVLRDFVCVPATPITSVNFPHALLGLVN
ncbi:hypothetical protein O7622_05015 [Micromonospora sp. WMMD1076]|uniref:hypothetical protein n=1 Tax=Micromonospora TaxID=1873 RepID=UPI00249B1047|nr:hypothetical protein [Micromonospora sp. WMMD1076]WFF07938.1 hypothetical protein O7622_05015 [Micromonospora sp. WMMD1076]